VAYSFVGRWFRLEGCGLLNEREGSRFLVCILRFLFALRCSQVTPQTEIRAGLTTWVRVIPTSLRMCPVANSNILQAAMAYIVRHIQFVA